MLSFIIIVLVLSSLFRRPRYWGFFPFMSGWGYRRPPWAGIIVRRWVALTAWEASMVWAAGSGTALTDASDVPSDLRGGVPSDRSPS